MKKLTLWLKKKWWGTLVVLLVLVFTTLVLNQYLQPRTVTEFIFPAAAATFGKIAGISPGNEVTIYIKVSNPELESHSVKISFVRLSEIYYLTYNPWGRYDKEGNPIDKIVPAISYQPAPIEAEQWFSLLTSDTKTWERIPLYPLQSKSIPFEISIPREAQTPKNWYFYLEVKDGDESGMVVQRAMTRVLVDMR